MSPELCIEPCGLVVAECALELMTDAVLAQRADGESNGVADGGVELGRKALELVVGAYIDPDTRALHADQHTPREGRRDSRALGLGRSAARSSAGRMRFRAAKCGGSAGLFRAPRWA